MKTAEQITSNFYNKVGWETQEEITEDARRWEDLREFSKEYVSKCRFRVLKYIPESGENILDMASGPIQFKEYLEYSKYFNKRYCIDLSLSALEKAEKLIGDHGVFLHGSFFDIQLENNFFDCAISLHTIYHMDKNKQEEAVRKLLDITKPGKPVIIVYSNPNSIMGSVLYQFARSLKRIFKKAKNNIDNDLYFYSHPNNWWKRFNDVANIQVVPWRSFDSDIQKRIIPNNKFGRKILNLLFTLEERYPNFFVKHFQYPMIILTKKDIC